MTDPKSIAEAWLNSPGARMAMRRYIKALNDAVTAEENHKTKGTAQSNALLAAAEREAQTGYGFILTFLKGWLIDMDPDTASHTLAVMVFGNAEQLVRKEERGK